jgi:hypothetical protein
MLKEVRKDVANKVEREEFNIIISENEEIKKNSGNFVSNKEMRKRLDAICIDYNVKIDLRVKTDDYEEFTERLGVKMSKLYDGIDENN